MKRRTALGAWVEADIFFRTGNSLWKRQSLLRAGGGPVADPPPAEITWEGPIVIDDAAVAVNGSTTFYNRYFRSTTLNVPAVQLKTTQAVTFIRCGFDSASWACMSNVLSGGIDLFSEVNVTVVNSKFYEGGRLVDTGGSVRAIRFRLPKRLVFRNNEVEKTGGVLIHGVTSDPVNEINISRNRWRDVNGNWKTLAASNGRSFDLVQMVQLNDVRECPNILIEWNDFYTRPGYGLEDTINLSHASGTLSSPLTIRYNSLRGGLPYPLHMASHTASAVVVEAGPYVDEATTPKISYPHNTSVHNNWLIGNTNASLNILHGYDNRAENNKVVGAGVIYNIRPDYSAARADGVVETASSYPDGTITQFPHAGISLLNYLNRTTWIPETPAEWFYNNKHLGTVVGYTNWTSANAYARREVDTEYPLDASGNEMTYTLFKAGQQITIQDEQDAYQEFLAAAAAASIIVGVEPVPAS